jgi:hypothetical protein
MFSVCLSDIFPIGYRNTKDLIYRKVLCISGEHMNNTIRLFETFFTNEVLIVKSVGKNLRSAKLYAILLASVMLVVIISLSPAISSLTSSFVIGNDGRIKEAGEQQYVLADSGSMVDIQAAVDEAADMGGGDVYIPEGVWDFVPIGTSWTSSNGVRIPAGVNVFGAPTERTSGLPEPTYGMSPNDQVVEWKTVLRIPWDMVGEENPQYPAFFYVMGNGDPTKPTQISDIKFSTYRDVDTSCRTKVRGVWLSRVVDFRVDHCSFSNLAGGAVWAEYICSGVIDHCRSVNTFGNAKPYGDIDALDYGFFSKPRSSTSAPLTDFLGKYGSRSVYIEDNYISRWRHCCLTDEGGHMIVRHNTFNLCLGYGDLDLHPNWGRCMEIYNNEFTNCLGSDPQRQVGRMHSGGGVVFGNHVDDSYSDGVLELAQEAGVTPEWYFWDNILDPGCGPLVYSGSQYATYSQPSGYTPYQYPHPLTVG